MKDVKPKAKNGPKPLSYNAHDPKTRRHSGDWRADVSAYFKSLGASDVP